MRPHILKSILLMAIFASTSAFSADTSAFDVQKYEKAKNEGKTVLVQFHASWCSTCVQQKTALQKTLNDPSFSKLVFFEADFDSEKELRKELKVSSQSTLVLFKGKNEVSRATGLTDEKQIKSFVKKAES